MKRDEGGNKKRSNIYSTGHEDGGLLAGIRRHGGSLWDFAVRFISITHTPIVTLFTCAIIPEGPSSNSNPSTPASIRSFALLPAGLVINSPAGRELFKPSYCHNNCLRPRSVFCRRLNWILVGIHLFHAKRSSSHLRSSLPAILATRWAILFHGGY